MIYWICHQTEWEHQMWSNCNQGQISAGTQRERETVLIGFYIIHSSEIKWEQIIRGVSNTEGTAHPGESSIFHREIFDPNASWHSHREKTFKYFCLQANKMEQLTQICVQRMFFFFNWIYLDWTIETGSRAASTPSENTRNQIRRS